MDRKPQPPDLMNVLVSYAYMSKDMLRIVEATQDSTSWLLDSGAFTAFQQGKVVNFDEYCSFLATNQKLFFQYIQLDAIGDPSVSGANLLRMVDKGLQPMPVFVLGEDEARIEEMVKINTRICVGGGVTEGDDYYGALLERLWRRVGGNCDLHGLGFTRGLRVLRTRVATVDSSSWLMGKRFGHFIWFDRLAEGCKHQPWGEMRTKPFAKLPREVQQVLMASGARPEHLRRDLHRGGLSMIGFQAAYAWIQYANACAQHGVRMFFASSVRYDVMTFLVAAKHAKRDALDWPGVIAELPELKERCSDSKDIDYVARYAKDAKANLRRVFGDTFPGRP